ncbi:MAG: phenylalanine--tRNA ligase subunit beta [Candidatus Levybacteria bacterium]|nr:phenylalanine--tRNA ligase subunit beta [Candidatus Levybacteria bacterium]
MLAPLSWLNDYVTVKNDPEKLGLRLSEVGLGTEKITKDRNDYIFEFEITPNRPDLLSIVGIAREIAALEKSRVTLPKSSFDATKVQPKKVLPLDVKTDPKINPRFTGIIIDGVSVKESPSWLKEKLRKIGQRSINNIVDITNFVMYELGNPIHAFDYDKIAGHLMQVDTAKSGEIFKSVDGISYHLPQGAVIIRDTEKIIDLCGIKGGFNSGTFPETKTIILRVPVEVPILIRRTSQYVSLRSDASSIFERAVNAGGTVAALERSASLMLELAGGEIASKLYDLKKENFQPWPLSLRLERLNQILGITIPEKEVITILGSLNLFPKLQKDTILCDIPTYRNDLKIEEDLIEEVARMYGYNNFPKTLPSGQIPTKQIPYFRDYRTDEKVKYLMTATGFSEVYTYSLVSEKDLNDVGVDSEKALRIDTPVSREYEYLRPNLKINLHKALKQNKANHPHVSLFELGKVYLGKSLTEAREAYHLAGISSAKSFREIKGLLERLNQELGTNNDPAKHIEILDEGIYFELNYSHLLENIKRERIFIPIAKYPPVIEDIALVVPEDTQTGDIIETIKSQSELIVDVSLLDKYQTTRTFHILYQDPNKNLTSQEVSRIREKIIKVVKENHRAELKA